jgi:dTMP kinase
MTGFFITLEGGEGVGKSTAAAGLARSLTAAGHELVVTREPGGTPGAEAIRALLLNPDIALDPMAQTLLHFAARADHVAGLIRPALARGAIVICDRFYDSTVAYQVHGQGVAAERVAALVAMLGLKPDLTFMLEVPVAVAETRRRARGGAADRYEQMGPEIMARIAQGFQEIAAAEPERCVVIDGTLPAEAVVAAMLASVQARLPK